MNAEVLIISTKEARKLLGRDGKLLSDSQIAELIETLTSLSSDFLQDLGSTNYNGSQNDTRTPAKK